MLHAILSDIHANHPALHAVLDDAHAQGASSVFCLGDLVGYHAFPRETLALVRERGIQCVAGNHDLMAVGRIPTDHCGPLARAAIEWTRGVLTHDDRAFLEALPLERRLGESTILVHALPWSTEARLNENRDFANVAAELVRYAGRVRCCFTGHTHVALTVRVGDDGTVAPAMPPFGSRKLGADALWFVNPGSVGLPRDRTRGASYLLYDDASKRVRFRRVGYDSRPVRERDLACGLGPPRRTPFGVLGETLNAVRIVAGWLVHGNA